MADASLKQRMYLSDLYDQLGWKKDGIRDMSVSEASTAISNAKRHIEEHGVPNDGTETYQDGIGDDSWW